MKDFMASEIENERLRYGIDHVQSHLYAGVCVVGARLRKAGHTVITITENLDAEAVVVLRRRFMLDFKLYRVRNKSEHRCTSSGIFEVRDVST